VITHPIALQSFGAVFLLLPEAIGTFRLVEYIGRELLTFTVPCHGTYGHRLLRTLWPNYNYKNRRKSRELGHHRTLRSHSKRITNLKIGNVFPEYNELTRTWIVLRTTTHTKPFRLNHWYTTTTLHHHTDWVSATTTNVILEKKNPRTTAATTKRAEGWSIAAAVARCCWYREERAYPSTSVTEEGWPSR